MELLPAICFIFSRIGCDNAAETVASSMGRKISLKTVPQEVKGDSAFNKYFPKKGRNKLQSKQSLNDLDPQSHKKMRHRSGNNYSDHVRNGITIEDNDGRLFRKQSNHVKEDVMSSIMEGDGTFSLEGLKDFCDEDRLRLYSECGLLSIHEIKQVMNRVRAFNNENPEIKFDDQTLDRFASHHVGQLPAHKAVVESLFRAQLAKVVYATETLVAGINMPARTTVICSLAKRRDDRNMKLLETSVLLQMACRGGRRGMDTDGTCIIVATPFEGPESAIEILTDELKPFVSQFTPSYSLVVNLIGRGNGTLDVARMLE